METFERPITAQSGALNGSRWVRPSPPKGALGESLIQGKSKFLLDAAAGWGKILTRLREVESSFSIWTESVVLG